MIYQVQLPIAGHAFIDVEADSRADAIQKALGAVTRDHIEEWEAIEQFNEGNVCYCPHPWEAVVADEDGNIVDEDE